MSSEPTIIGTSDRGGPAHDNPRNVNSIEQGASQGGSTTSEPRDPDRGVAPYVNPNDRPQVASLQGGDAPKIDPKQVTMSGYPSDQSSYLGHFAGESVMAAGHNPGMGKMHKVMHEFKHGTLHSGSKHGPKVRSRKQAIAIGMSEARRHGEDM